MSQFSRGDQVQLKRAFARSIMRDRKHPDWLKRRGVVLGSSFNAHFIYVLWDGRKSNDQVPIKALEKAA